MKGILYFTDGELNSNIMELVQKQLNFISQSMSIPITCVSLGYTAFGDTSIKLPLKRSNLSMFKQILVGLENIDADIVFFCEHDVLYHPSHFNFIPLEKDVYYYNTNVWKVNVSNDLAVRVTNCKQTSGLCAYKDLLIQHYRQRVKRVEEEGFTRAMGFEPGTHHREERIDDFKADGWESEFPNLDIRHKNNWTKTKWKPEQFRNKRFAEGWTEDKVQNIKGWKFESLQWLNYQ